MLVGLEKSENLVGRKLHARLQEKKERNEEKRPSRPATFTIWSLKIRRSASQELRTTDFEAGKLRKGRSGYHFCQRTALILAVEIWPN